MSIRILGLYLFTIGFSIAAYRRTFYGVCAALFLISVIQHPDMPKSMAGIQGLNLWNVLMLNVIVSWVFVRKEIDTIVSLPKSIKFTLITYVFIIFANYLRLLSNTNIFPDDISLTYITSEYLINNIKWIVPGILLFYTCNSEKDTRIALFILLFVYFFLAVQVIKWVPLGTIKEAGNLSIRAYKAVQDEVGFNRVTLSAMLSGASWGVFSCLPLFKRYWQKAIILFVCGTIVFGQALTGGRTGYVAWVLIGLTLCILKWRRYLPLVPIAIFAILTFVPGVRDRVFQGLGFQEGAIVYESDDAEMTSGRSVIWPYVLDKISDNPIFGYGRLSMKTTGLERKLIEDYNENFPHPHNAYLEVLLDSGIIGLICIIPFYTIIIKRSLILFMSNSGPLNTAVGASCFAIVASLLLSSMGGQTFYPREGACTMFGIMGLMLRQYESYYISNCTFNNTTDKI